MKLKFKKVFIVILCVICLFTLNLFYSNLTRSKGHTAEYGVMKRMRSIFAAQFMFAAGVTLDQDGDSVGEYGYLQELCGESKGRMDTELHPRYLSISYNTQRKQGIARVFGYYICMYLPGTGRETALVKRATDKQIIDEQEKCWICYAWPVKWQYGSRKVFAIDANGETHIMENTNISYEGLEKIPKAIAAMPLGSGATIKYFQPIKSGKGVDGEVWTSINDFFSQD